MNINKSIGDNQTIFQHTSKEPHTTSIKDQGAAITSVAEVWFSSVQGRFS